LLTIFYLYKVLCSDDPKGNLKNLVVNCLQFFIFTRFFAVWFLLLITEFLLWIAYNFLSLQGSLQFKKENEPVKVCCELLTIFYLYKKLGMVQLGLQVVNCLQFFIFTRFFAVTCHICPFLVLLWIAYNFLSLQGSLQLQQIY